LHVSIYNPILIIIIYLYINILYSKKWLNQRVYHSTSNYITHYRHIYKAFNIDRVLAGIEGIFIYLFILYIFTNLK